MGEREKLLREPVEDVEIDPNMTLSDLIEVYGRVHGFMAGHLVRAVKILCSCLDADLRILTFTANLVATGLRGIFAQLLREGIFNLVITTCGSIDHDIARSTGGRYYKGYFEADDRMLYELNIHRLGNIYIPVEDYGPRIEKFVYEVLGELEDREYGVYEILWEIGRRLDDRNSILRVAYEKRIPVIVPGYLDGAFGTALYTYYNVHRRPKINAFLDEQVLADLFFKPGKTMALIVGGGISKHHTIWWAQFREGLDCAVYITTAVEYDGSLSGAQPREAVSWGKIRPEANTVVVYGDATIIVPLIAAALLAEWRKRRAGADKVEKK